MTVEDGGKEGDKTLTLKQIVKCSPRDAFKAFTESGHLSRWFTTGAVCDLRVGGDYRNADGDRGKYLEILPPNSVKFTWDNEKHCPGTIVEVKFEGLGEGKSKMTLVHSNLASQEDFEDMRKGWTWALASLRSYLERGKPISFESWESGKSGR